MSDVEGSVPGLDVARLAAYLSEQVPGLLTGELTARVIAGGKSNLTYEVSDGTTAVIVRRPPLGHVLPTAHDMRREHAVMSALAATAVPVPKMHVLCRDESVIGAPFYVMSKAAGTPFRRADELQPLGPERTRRIALRMIDVLADLHRVEPDAVGLHEFGRPAGFLRRQVDRWGAQLAASHSRELAGAAELASGLAAAIPQEQPPAIVHGDYRLDNLLVDTDNGDEVTAVLDWEMATLGDPLTDVALLTVYQRIADMMPVGDGGSALVTNVSRAPGYPTPDEMIAEYAGRSGRDVGRLGFYEALAYYKLAVILEGIHYRHTQGKTVGAGFADIGGFVEPLLAGGLQALRADN